MSTFLILAAGNSTRFGGDKLTEPIGDYTLPQRAAGFAVDNGCSRLCLTVNRNAVMTDGESIFHQVVNDVRRIVPDVEIAFQDPNQYGPGAAVTAWEGRIHEPFTVLFGDNLYKGTLPEMPDSVAFSYRSLPSHPRNLQLAAVIDGYVVEKPHARLSGDYFCGFAHFPKDYFLRLPGMQRSARGEYEITDMINMDGRPVGFDLDEFGITWADITYKSDIPVLESLVL